MYFTSSFTHQKDKLMKPYLLLFTLLTVTCIVHAQTVLVKDSVVDNFTESFQLPGTPTTYAYDSACRLVMTQSPGGAISGGQNFFTYYPNSNNIYQVVSTILQGNLTTGVWIWRTSYRRTYTYNDKGNITSYEYGSWDTLTGTFPPNYGDTFLYSGDVKTKSFSRHRDSTTLAWVTVADTSFYYNNKGQLDSLVAVSHPSEQKTALYFSYYSSGKLYKTTDSPRTGDSAGIYHFYDSTGYISTDSAVAYSHANSGDSLIVSYISTLTTYYDENNRKTEDLFHVVKTYLLSGFIYSKTFYTYGVCQSVFPVSYVDFNVIRLNDNAVLNWQTATEINTSSFQIQRSTDGVHFTVVGSVKASGNSSHQAYTFTDVNALLLNISKLYYRLAERDYNGSISYSKTVVLDIAAGKLFVHVSPNPVTGSINIYAASTMGAAQIIVTDMRGKVAYSGKQNIVAGNKISINASGFAKGIYIVTIQSTSQNEQLKIVKE